MELSVIVPVYNMADGGKLKYCMDSLVAQTLQDMEIIAVDDASTDNSLEILREYEKNYPGRVVVIASPENKKQGGARNLGLQIAKGRYIGFMDSDDWAQKDMFEKMVNKARETGADVVGTDLCLVREHTMIPTVRVVCNELTQTGILDYEKRKAFLLKPGPVVTKIYAREVFFEREFHFPERMFYEDNAIAIELGMRIKHYEHIPEPNYFYYQLDTSTTHAIDQKKCEDRMEAMRIMLRLSKQNGAWERYRDVLEYYYGTLFYRNTLFGYMQGSSKKDLRFIGKIGREIMETFPNFRENPYFQKEIDAYERKLIDLHLKSVFWFVIVYELKMIARKFKA